MCGDLGEAMGLVELCVRGCSSKPSAEKSQGTSVSSFFNLPLSRGWEGRSDSVTTFLALTC